MRYRNTKCHGNVDELSRLPLPFNKEQFTEVDVYNLDQIKIAPVTAKKKCLQY